MLLRDRTNDGFDKYLREIRDIPKLDRATEHALATRWWEDRDLAAAHELVSAHLRDVVAIASKYRGYGFRLADLVEEGNIGLMEAVQRFDPTRNLRFMTYAAYWIRACILAHVLRQWSLVGIGTGPRQSRMFFRLHRERARLHSQLGEDETVAGSLAASFNTSEDNLRQVANRLERRDLSLDADPYDEGHALIDRLRDEGASQEDVAAGAETAERVRSVVSGLWDHLDDRERIILSERLVWGEDGATLADIGRRLGLSRERVRQLEARVLSKLRPLLAPLAHAA